MADATTTLNPGTGGDVMDESLVQQSSGTNAKRPRVVLGSDVGGLTDPQQIVLLLEQLVVESRAQTVLLQALLSTSAQPLSMDEIYNMAAQLHNQ